MAVLKRDADVGDPAKHRCAWTPSRGQEWALVAERVEERYTVKEYFALEEQSDLRYEDYDGHLVALSGASPNHNRIVPDTVTELNIALRGGRCEVFSNDMRVAMHEANYYVYPDIAVACEEPAFAPGRFTTLPNPVVIVEVLSPSTAAND